MATSDMPLVVHHGCAADRAVALPVGISELSPMMADKLPAHVVGGLGVCPHHLGSDHGRSG
jgi:hypothetical protein